LRIQPILGRQFTAQENVVGSPQNVLLISDRLWRTQFESKTDLIGQSIRIDDQGWTVVGVLPKGFRGLSDSADLWAPVVTQFPASLISDRGNMWLDAIARLKPHTPIERARSDLEGVANRLALQFSDTNKDRHAEVMPLQEDIYGNLRPITLVLVSSVVVLFLALCLTIANLEMEQAEARRAEISLRLALGARFMRIFRQFGIESMLLVFAGCAIALPVAAFGLKELNLGETFELPSFAKPELNLTVVLLVALFAVTVGLTLGFFASSQANRRGIMEGLRESGRSTPGHSYARGLMVTAQVALAVALLVSATLLERTFHNLRSIDPGYQQNTVLTFNISLPRSVPSSKSAVQEIVSSLTTIPGVTNVSASSNTPLDGEDTATDVYLEGMNQNTDFPRVHTHRIDAAFFDVLGVKLPEGRSFTTGDVASGRRVAIVSQKLATRYWPAANAIGKTLTLNPELKGPSFEIVGVAPDLLFRNIPESSDKDPDVYVPLNDRNRLLGFLLRWGSPVPPGMITVVQAKVREALPGAPVYNMATIAERVNEQMQRFKFAARLMLVFAGAAVLLAITGTYGVTSYAVAQRTREFAIRIALGAPVQALIGLVLRAAVVFAVSGIAVGIIASSLLSHLLVPLLYGIAPVDFRTYLFAATLSFAVIASSCLIPTWRVLAMNATAVLRSE
jgi:putative ABC transport system permease protein